MNRREVLGTFSAFALMASLAEAQTATTAAPGMVKVFKFADFPVTHNPTTGATGRGVPNELMCSGDITEVHITTLDPGKEFGPMRKNPFCGFRLIHAGKMEVLVEGMPPQTAEAGDIVYASADQTFHVRNAGDTPLTYFVIQIKLKPAAA
jgi:hypothetical protein